MMENKRRLWLEQKDLPEDLRSELIAMEQDAQWCRDAFGKELEFGTSGLRGIMGAGTNRMNRYVVRKVTQGLANYIWKWNQNPAVAIGYDSRIHSEAFAKETACVLCANGVSAYLFSEITPVAALSFAVRKLNCCMGVMITASHNPKEYNGYKVYDGEGCQITGTIPQEILQECEAVDLFEGVRYMDFEEAQKSDQDVQCRWIEKELLSEYVECAFAQQLPWDTPESMKRQMGCLKVVYTPLNGAGQHFVKEVLQRLGVTELYQPQTQVEADGNFLTCPYPNPEKWEAFHEGTALCRRIEGDLVLATDPDCDRVGVVVRTGEKSDTDRVFRLLTGNELGVLLFEFICRMRKESRWASPVPENPVAARSLVSTPLADRIAEAYGVKMEVTLTGFKYICRYMSELEAKGQQNRFLFGFEESNGYLPGIFTRDKDGVSTAMLVCQMAAWHKANGRTLLQALDLIYETWGYYHTETINTVFEGYDGDREIASLMKSFRHQPLKELNGIAVTKMTDYMTQTERNLPKADLLQLCLADGSSCMIRPSGTEPKLKFYIFVRGTQKQNAGEKGEAIKRKFFEEIKKRKENAALR